MTDVNTLLQNIIDRSPTDFADNIQSILADKADAAIANARVTIAKEIYGGEDPEVDSEDNDFDFEPEDDDWDDAEEEDYTSDDDSDVDEFDDE